MLSVTEQAMILDGPDQFAGQLLRGATETGATGGRDGFRHGAVAAA